MTYSNILELVPVSVHFLAAGKSAQTANMVALGK
jgi:hypothetical protein